MIEMAENINHAILFSGDGDFRRVVESIQRKGVYVTVVSTTHSNPLMIADELRRQADDFIDLKTIRSKIESKGGNKTPNEPPFVSDLSDPYRISDKDIEIA